VLEVAAPRARRTPPGLPSPGAVGWVGAAQDGDLVAQHEELDVLGGGRAAHQEDQPEHLPEDQVQQPQRHTGIMSDRRSLLVSDRGPTSGTPQGGHGVEGEGDVEDALARHRCGSWKSSGRATAQSLTRPVQGGR
jgi:hypothetical protein